MFSPPSPPHSPITYPPGPALPFAPKAHPACRAAAVAAHEAHEGLTRGRDLGLRRPREWLGGTPLRLAANMGDHEYIRKLLVEAGSAEERALARDDVHGLSLSGQTVLSGMLTRGNISLADSIIYLVEHGAAWRFHAGDAAITGRHHEQKLLKIEPLLERLADLGREPRPLSQAKLEQREELIQSIRSHFTPPRATDLLLHTALEPVGGVPGADAGRECFSCKDLLSSQEYSLVRLKVRRTLAL